MLHRRSFITLAAMSGVPVAASGALAFEPQWRERADDHAYIWFDDSRETGGGFYRVVGEEPAHKLTFQSDDGRWWEYCLPSTGLDLAAAGFFEDNDPVENTLALRRAIDFLALREGGIVQVPAGRFRIAALDDAGAAADRGSAVILDESKSNIAFMGVTEQLSILVPASNRVEMFAQTGAANIVFSRLAFDNSEHGRLEYQVKFNRRERLSNPGRLENRANCAIRQYEGSGLHVERCVFRHFNTATHYSGSDSDNAALVGHYVSIGNVYEDCSFGNLIDSPQTYECRGIRSYRTRNSPNGNNTDGTVSDETINSNDAGHALYVADRSGPEIPQGHVSDFFDQEGESSCIKIRKGKNLVVRGVTIDRSGRGVEFGNLNGGTVSDVSGTLATTADTQQNFIEFTNCGFVDVTDINGDLGEVDAYGLRLRDAERGIKPWSNKALKFSNISFRISNIGAREKPVFLVYSQQDATVESPFLVIEGDTTGWEQYLFRISDSRRLSIHNPRLAMLAGEDGRGNAQPTGNERLYVFDKTCADCTILLFEPRNDKGERSRAMVDRGSGNRLVSVFG